MAVRINFSGLFLILIAGALLTGCSTSQKVKKGSQEGSKASAEYPDNSSLFIVATSARLQGHPEEARKLYQRCLEINPNDAASMYELARIYLGRNEMEPAEELLGKATKIEPENEYYLQLYASLLQALGKYREAVDVYERLVALKPGNVEFTDNLAIAWLYAGKPEKAIEVYDRLEERVGVTEELIMKKHSIYLQEEKINEAAREVKKLINKYPGEAKYWSVLAELYVSGEKYTEALEAYEKVRELDPDNPYIDISMADFYRKLGESEKAMESLRAGFRNAALDIDTKIQVSFRFFTEEELYTRYLSTGLELTKILVEVHPEDPKAWAMHGDLLFNDKQYAASRDALKKVVDIDPGKYIVWEQLLVAQAQLNEGDSLLALSLRANELFPEQPLPYLFAGGEWYRKKEWHKCVETLEDGLKLVSGNDAMLLQFYTYLGDAYQQLGDHRMSDQSYEAALSIDPNNAYVLNNYAYYLSLRGEKLEQAAQMAKKATEIDPSSSNLDTYAWVLFKLGYFAEAESWIMKAIEYGGDTNPVILEHYGDILWKLNKQPEAVAQWKKALEAGKGSDLLEKKVADQTYYE